MIKCPECRGCMKYRLYNSKSYYYCDFCRVHWHRLPGGGLEKVEEKLPDLSTQRITVIGP